VGRYVASCTGGANSGGGVYVCVCVCVYVCEHVRNVTLRQKFD
jgi:hypothetical protein